jgi:uncharacterized protein YllA (UPF0747 family)
MSMLDFSSLPSQVARLKGSGRSDSSRLFISEADWCSSQTIENIRRLQLTDSVAVVATVNANILGGAVSQIVKCLTAIKASEELGRRSIAAVPVCRIRDTSPANDSVTLLDSEGEPHRLSLNQQRTSDFISGIEELGRGTYDPEIMGIIRRAYSPQTPLLLASARIFSNLMKEWGLVVLDPQMSFLELVPESISEEARNVQLPVEAKKLLFQSFILPVIVSIVDPCDLDAFAVVLPFFDRLNLVRPIAWPASSVTMMDPKSRRTLDKYNLGIADLFAGETETMNKMQSRLPGSDKLSGFRSAVEQTMAELEALLPNDDEFLKTKRSCKEKIIYQIEKLRINLETAVFNRLQVANRQVHKACNFLAPGGRPQQQELAGVYFLLRYSRFVLQNIYERLDGMASEHQLISLD